MGFVLRAHACIMLAGEMIVEFEVRDDIVGSSKPPYNVPVLPRNLERRVEIS